MRISDWSSDVCSSDLLAAISRTLGDPDAAIEQVRAAARVNERRDDASLDDRVFTQLSLGGALYSRDPTAAEQVFREVLQQIRGTELEGGSRRLSALGGVVATRDQQDKTDAEPPSRSEERSEGTERVRTG